MDTGKRKANGSLMKAARSGDIGAIRAAIADGADDLGGALIQAAWKGWTLALSYLLDAGADIHCAKSGLDALSIAAGRGHAEMVGLLLERGANPGARQSRALFEAAGSGDLETARLLLDAGAPVNPRRSAERRPLHAAIATGDLPMMELLIARRANLDANWGEALAQAALHGQERCGQLLIDRGASAAHAACRYRLHMEEIRALAVRLDIPPQDRAEIEYWIAEVDSWTAKDNPA